MIYNYHMHTHRCGHASGTEEEYVLRAIECGIKYMGFSDHFPLKHTDGSESSYRVPVNEAKNYVCDVLELKEKYRDKADIKVGFEMEYFSEYFDEMLENAIEYGAEYLILGQHFLKPEYPDGVSVTKETDDTAVLSEYIDSLIEAMKKSVFSYVAHPDIIKFKGNSKDYQKEIRRLCISSRELNVPLEINFLGIRDKRIYPNSLFWQVAGEEQCPVTFGFDSHDVSSAYDGASLEAAVNIVKKK